MKVKCIKVDMGVIESGLEEGKIYEGELNDFCGEKRWKIEGFEDWDFFEDRFIKTGKEKTYFCIDNSGSTNSSKRNKSIKIIDKYINSDDHDVELIKHTTVASEISYNDYKNGQAECGGTYISSGLKMIFDKLINLKMNDRLKDYSSINVLVLSDGDNWSEDNHRVEFFIKEFKNMGVNIKFYDILPSSYSLSISERLNKKGIISNEEFEVVKEVTRDTDEENTQDMILKIKQEESKVEVSILKDTRVIGEGTAKCLPEDTFNKDIGILVGLMKALNVDKKDFLTIFSNRELLYGLHSRI